MPCTRDSTQEANDNIFDDIGGIVDINEIENKANNDNLENDNLENDNLENDNLENDNLENDNLENDNLENDNLENDNLENDSLENDNFENDNLENDGLKNVNDDGDDVEENETDLHLNAMRDDAQVLVLLGKTMQNEKSGLGSMRDTFFDKISTLHNSKCSIQIKTNGHEVRKIQIGHLIPVECYFKFSYPKIVKINTIVVLACSKFRRSVNNCLLYTSPSPRDRTRSRMPSSA